MPWGHRSIAKAIYNYLQDNNDKNFEIIYREVKAEVGIAEEAYKFIYKVYPSAGRLTYMMDKNKMIAKLSQEMIKKNLPRLKMVIEKVKPNLIISAYFLHSQSLARWRKEKRKSFKLWTVVADPWKSYSLAFVKDADKHLVYDHVASKLAQNLGINKDSILETGWWVRPDMYKKHNREESRKKLGFEGNYPVIFVGGGSLGTNALPRVLSLLMLAKDKVGVIFNTGTDKLSYTLVEEYERLFKKIRWNKNVVIKNLGWIDNMAEVLSACDIVFGKAGPNFLFDTVALEKPFVAITHIGGQEDGNIDLIIKKRLGWVKEKSDELSEFFLRYLKNPQKYNHYFDRQIHTEALKNKMSLMMIKKEVERTLS